MHYQATNEPNINAALLLIMELKFTIIKVPACNQENKWLGILFQNAFTWNNTIKK